MSLFRAREWWFTTSGYEEFHDLGCLCAANIDNSPSKYDKIIVNSFQGLLRIYHPHPPGFSPDHVMLERRMELPVLQVAAGCFVQGSEDIHLAVLHPRELRVHSLVSMETEQGPQYSLSLAYRHQLQRTAYNMVIGPFGTRVKDYICVQSMDGQLCFFHHETAAFSCFLPEFLLPGPIQYLPRTDCVITVNSARMLQAFRYQNLSVASSTGDGERDRPTTGKKIVPDWSVNIGEHAVSLKVVTISHRPSQILVLGERSVFCFKESGALKFMKKLDFNPSCMHAYGVLPPQEGEDGLGAVQYIISTHTNQLFVFRDSTLVWAARVDHPPADITVANFQDLQGVLVTLDELGHVTCSYLGTDPTIFSAAAMSAREPNYEELDKEMTELQRVIRESQREGVTRLAVATLVLLTEVDPITREVEVMEGEDGGMEGEGEEGAGGTGVQKCVEVKLHLSSSTGALLSDVSISITTSPPLTLHPSHLHFSELSDHHLHDPQTITVVATATILPCTRHITVSAVYTTATGLSHISEKEVQLPLSLFCQPCQPSKANQHKITLDTNHTAVSLHAIFPDFLPSSGEGVGPQNAMGFQLLAGPEVTVVASKSSKRYRLQSESFPAMAVVLEELVARLVKHHAGKEPVFEVGYSSPLPLNEYFEIIERHFELRKNIQQCGELLGRHAQQFRAIQKRLLTRFKDKTPVGLAHLDTLLDGTYMQLMALGEKSESFEAELMECSSQLSLATQLVNNLLRLSVHMNDEDYAVLKASLSPTVITDSEQGWEEQTDAAITHLLRTSLAKSAKDQSASVSAIELPPDSQRLKRHIALLCDRISKGGSLGVRTQGLPKLTVNGVTTETTRSLTEKRKEAAMEEGRGGRPPKAEVPSKLPVSHSVKKPSLPALPEDKSENETAAGYQLTDL